MTDDGDPAPPAPAPRTRSGGTDRRRSGLPVGDLPDRVTVTTALSPPASAMAVGAHPDDVEFGCGATLARWAAGGTRVHHVVLTDGSKGTWDPAVDAAELVRTRQDEARAAAAVLAGRPAEEADDEARVLFVGETDGELRNGPVLRSVLVEHLRRLRPEVVLAHDPWRRYRLHPDHREAGFLTLDAVVAARDPLFFPEIGPGPLRPRAVLLWEADEPNHVEDAQGYDRLKVEALLRHRSQLRSTMGIDDTTGSAGSPAALEAFAGRVRRQLADHGALGGLALGEAFHLIDQV